MGQLRLRHPVRIVFAAVAAAASLGACGVNVTLPESVGAGTAQAVSVPALLPASAGGPANLVAAAAMVSKAVATVDLRGSAETLIGSGLVIATSGGYSYLVTNHHVVAGKGTIQILMPSGAHAQGSLLGSDPFDDLAVIRVRMTLPVARLASSAQVRVGDPVIAIGSPYGESGAVTAGVVSGLRLTLTGVSGPGGTEALPDVMQLDLGLNPGNSGGPVVNGQGLVIGLSTASATAQKVGYAIPSDSVWRSAVALANGKTPEVAFLGVCSTPVSQILGEREVAGYGAVVDSVLPGSPAAQAGLRAGDVIESAGGVALNDGSSLNAVIESKSAGQRISVLGLRGSSTLALGVSLTQRPLAAADCQA